MKRKISFLLAALMVLSILLTGCGAAVSDQLGARDGVAVIYSVMSFSDGIDSAELGLADYYYNYDNGYLWDELYGEKEKGDRGSGFFIGESGKDPQYLITNHHVIELFLKYNSGDILSDGLAAYGTAVNASLRVYFDSSNYTEAQVIAYNSSADVAVLRLTSPTDKRKPLVIKEPDDKDISTQVYAIGFPGLTDNAFVNSNSKWSTSDATVTSGVISNFVTSGGNGVRRVQFDASISGGNSGGPLVNSKGQVLGVNAMSVTSGTDSVNYAIDIREAMDLLDRNNIPYATAGGFSIPSYAIWILAGVLVVAVIVVIIVLVAKSNKKPVPDNRAVLPDGGRTPIANGDTGLRVQGLAGSHQGRRYAVIAGKTMIFGRNAGSTISYPAGAGGVSGSHCSLWYENGKVFLKDNGSTYGTFVGGSKLVPNQAVILNVGDTFSLGSQKEQFRLEGRN